MAIGVYKALHRSPESESTTPGLFTNNIQIWLSLFAFSALIISIIWSVFSGVVTMFKDLNPWWFNPVMIILFLVIIAFVIIAIYSLWKLVKLYWRGRHGITIEYNPKTIPLNVLQAIEPISKGDKEYIYIVNKLIKHNNRLIERNKELIAEYQKVISKMEVKSDEGKT